MQDGSKEIRHKKERHSDSHPALVEESLRQAEMWQNLANQLLTSPEKHHQKKCWRFSKIRLTK